MGTSECTRARAGYFVAARGASAETICDSGRFSGPAATECATCINGTYSSDGAEACDLAAAGYHVPFAGSSKQIKCAAGTFSGSGEAACRACPSGTTSDEGASSTPASVSPRSRRCARPLDASRPSCVVATGMIVRVAGGLPACWLCVCVCVVLCISSVSLLRVPALFLEVLGELVLDAFLFPCCGCRSGLVCDSVALGQGVTAGRHVKDDVTKECVYRYV